MRHLTRSWAAAFLLGAAACADSPAGTLPPETPKTPPPLGVYEIAVHGIGTNEMRSSIQPRNPGGGSGPNLSLSVAGNGIVFEQIASSSFTEGTRTGGGQRYVSFTYRVRNGTGGALNNLTMLMVSRAGTIAGTPLSSLRRFDGLTANPAIATQVVPTGAVAMRSDLVNMQALYPDVVQVFTEAEIAAIPLPGDVTGAFPYGYVVRSAAAEGTTRSIPAATSDNDYGGLLTLSFRIPLQSNSSADVFSLFFQVMAIQDTETRLTETMEEAQDTAAVRRLRERAAALGATTVTVLPGSTTAASDVADYPGQRQLCSVRTAGTSASPVTYVTNPAGYTRLDVLRPGESASACGANFRSGTATAPTLNSAYSLTLRAMDRYGNLITTAADTVAVTQSSGPAATFGASVALVSGQASVPVTYQANGTSLLVARGRRTRGERSIEIATPATIALSAGNNQAALAGQAVPTAPAVVVRDLSSNPLSGVPVTFTVTGGGGFVGSVTAYTNASGVATAGSWTLGTPATVNTLSATAAGASGSVAFTASGCGGGGGTGYRITLCYTSTMTATQRAAFESAAARWSRVITADLSDVPVSLAAGVCGTGQPSFNLSVDDLLIFAAITPIDGVGSVLGSAGPCYVRGSGTSFLGTMQFDAADMAGMETAGMLEGVILHEMGHVLGIGTLWQYLGLLQNPSSAGSPLDTWFSGANGITGFNNVGGSTYTGGQKVPVENTGGGGTMNAHWRESVLANELMTGYANAGSMPLSQLTVRSLADMGYTVDVSAADAFFLTLSMMAGPAEGSVKLVDDVADLPLYRTDENGRTTRLR